jgi:hypothetical protein
VAPLLRYHCAACNAPATYECAPVHRERIICETHRLSGLGLGCVKTPGPAVRVEKFRIFLEDESQNVLHTCWSITNWRIVFSTFFRCMSYHRVVEDVDRGRADHSGKIYAQVATSTLAGLEDFPSQSCRRHCIDGPVRRADDLVSAIVWIADPAARAPGAGRVGSHRPSDHRMDCAAIYRGIRLARRTALCGAGPGPALRPRIHSARSRHGHSGPANLGALTLAEWICREAHRLDPTRMS